METKLGPVPGYDTGMIYCMEGRRIEQDGMGMGVP